jgi:hypothetical protein
MAVKSDGVPIDKHLLIARYAADPNLLQMTGTDYQQFRDARLAEIRRIAEATVNIYSN